ncbi:helix-turn-helix domain-containing protein [Streptomyces longwoodensis]|uniref:helix-turn-helix domain-containing protein n=1 Tax=Streptomyces longwoodensis TaxID=68231 RepID=UPI0036EEE2C9
MKIRADIAELLRAGLSQTQIAKQLHCAPVTVQRTREALRIPSPGQGRSASYPTTFEQALRERTRPSNDGQHLLWTGWTNSAGAPLVSVGKRKRSAYQVAFELHHGREAVGRVTPGCGIQGCVRGDHLDDQPMRRQNEATYTAIFGGAA